MRRILVCLVLLSGCASTRTGYASDDFRADCPDVADAYEAARAHLGCRADWWHCPVTESEATCIEYFAIVGSDSPDYPAATCSTLDGFASSCSR